MCRGTISCTFHSANLFVQSTFCLIAFSLMFAQTASGQGVVYVDQDAAVGGDGSSWATAFQTIQEGADAAEAGIETEVWVAEGVYTGMGDQVLDIPEDIEVLGGFNGTENLRSERNIEDNPTIIDGEGTRRGVWNEGILDGFTIQSCNADNVSIQSDNGAAIYSNGTIRNCRIAENIQEYGSIVDATGAMTDCVVENNRSSTIMDIQLFQLEDTIVSNNEYTRYLLYVRSGDTVIDKCEIVDNTGPLTSDVSNLISTGGYSQDLSLEIINTMIYRNSFFAGSIVSAYNSGSAYLENLLIYGNDVKDHRLALLRLEDAEVIHSTIVGKPQNDTYDVGVTLNGGRVLNSIVWGFGEADIDASDKVEISNSCFFEAKDENGNISVYPQFVNFNGVDSDLWDLSLLDGSPCVDTGDLAAAPAEDVFGAPRPGGDSLVCMGAIESPDAFEGNGDPEQLLISYVSKSGDGTDGQSWNTAFTTLDDALSSRTITRTSNYEVRVAQGVYAEGKETSVPKYVTLLGGWKGDALDPEARDIESFETIIDGENSYPCLRGYGGLIEGFTIRNGKAEDFATGGGVSLLGGVLRKCKVNDNEGNSIAGVYARNAVIDSCRVYSNQGADVGGVTIEESDLVNSLVYANHSMYGAGSVKGTGRVLHSTIFGNRSGYFMSHFSPYFGISPVFEGSMRNSIVWSEPVIGLWREQSFYSCFDTASDQNGNISLPPRFANIEGDPSTWDLTPLNGSPTIDRGALETSIEFDILGNSRPGGDNAICMGAIESPDEFTPDSDPPPIRIVHVSLDGDNTDGDTWSTAYTSIIDAINDHHLDILEVRVAEGTYIESETIQISGNVSLLGGYSGNMALPEQRDPEDYITSLNGNGERTVVFNYGRLEGVQVTQGYSLYQGGGVFNLGTIEDCLIENNYAHEGGGIFNSGVIKGSVIRNNEARLYGGGISQKGVWRIEDEVFDDALVSNCIVESNIASGSGGGILSTGGTVEFCTVANNKAESESFSSFNKFGGGVYLLSSSIKNSKVLGNQAEEGGGIYAEYYSLVENCSLLANEAVYGGAVKYDNRSDVNSCTLFRNKSENTAAVSGNFSRIENSIIWENDGGDLLPSIDDDYHPDFYEQIRNSCFPEAFTLPLLFGDAPSIQIDESNVSGDPMFVDVSGDDPSQWDLRLQPGSPCIDRANVETVPATDIDGNPRPGVDGLACIGAYESAPELEPGDRFQYVPVYLSQDGNNTSGDSWETAFDNFTSVTLKLRPTYAYDIRVAQGLYQFGEEIEVAKATKVSGGWKGDPLDPEAQDIELYETIIDGNNSHRVFYNEGVLEKLTVQNGFVDANGGGALNLGTIQNCSFIQNSASFGGGVDNRGEIKSSYFRGNSAESGGGVYNNERGEILQSTFEENTAIESGGGVWNLSDSYNRNNPVRNSLFRRNEARNGGGLYGGGIVEACRFIENTAEANGGGVYIFEGDLLNSELISNNAGNKGTSVFLGEGTESNKEGRVFHSTIVEKSSMSSGTVAGKGYVKNSIIWNLSDQPLDLQGASIEFWFTNFQSSVGEHCFSFNPEFVNVTGEDPEAWDLRLSEASPLIDLGERFTLLDNQNSFGAVTRGYLELDYSDNPRPGVDGAICIGAHESPPEYTSDFPETDVLYVSLDGDNSNGESWQTAFTSLSQALAASVQNHPTEILLDRGDYSEGKEIIIPYNIAVIGGSKDGGTTSFNGQNSYRCFTNYGRLESLRLVNGAANGVGGAILNFGHVVDCAILDSNATGSGGAIASFQGTITGSRMEGNASENDGGGLFASDTETQNLTLVDNTSQGSGGGAYIDRGSLHGGTISMNFSNADGGGLYLVEANAEELELSENTALGNGGGLYGVIADIDRSHVLLNQAARGGGLYFENGNARNCAVYANKATVEAGGIYEGVVNFCTVVRNEAPEGAGAITDGSFTNSICYFNVGTDLKGSNESYGFFPSQLRGTVFETAIGVVFESENVIRTAPEFHRFSGFEPEEWDLRLSEGSIGVDVAVESYRFQYNPPPFPTTAVNLTIGQDLTGEERPGNDGLYCVGAYESPDAFRIAIDEIRYVSPTINGVRGDNEYGTITAALTGLDSELLYEIRLAEGYYTEGATLVVPENVEVSGSWSSDFMQQDREKFPTIINGEDTYRVFNNSGVLRSLTIEKGFSSSGPGGVQNHGLAQIIDCELRFNQGTEGGAVGFGTVIDSTLLHNKAVIGGGSYRSNVSRSTISFNRAAEHGGGVSGGSVNECEVTDNEALFDGGGTHQASVSNSRILRNTARRRGGGVYIKGAFGRGGPIADSIIAYNKANDNDETPEKTFLNSPDDDGGGIYGEEANVERCRVFGNYAGDDGGGIHLFVSTIENTLVYRNKAEFEGGGILFRESGSIAYCTVTENEAQFDGGIRGPADVFRSISWKNQSGNISALTSTLESCFPEATGEDGNISEDPLFVDTSADDLENWNLSLLHGSPCIDVSEDSSGGRVYDDFNRNPRPGADFLYDIGAYESEDFMKSTAYDGESYFVLY